MESIELNVDASKIHGNEVDRETNCSRGRIEIDLNLLPCGEEDESETEGVDGDYVKGNTFSGNAAYGHQLETPVNTNRNNYLSNNDRLLVLHMFLAESINGKLKKHTTRWVASQFSVNMKNVQQIWRRYKMNVGATVTLKCNCGRKRTSFDPEEIRQVPLRRRTTIRSLAYVLNVSKSTIHKYLKEGKIRRHSSSLQPLLTDENKEARSKFCLSMLEEDSISNDPTFKEMYNVIHIDEKWVYLTANDMNFYLLPDEEDSLRTCKNKNYIQRVMFLVVVACPRFDENRVKTFSRKIVMFQFIVQEPSRQRSVNRPTSTLETKPITSISREVAACYQGEMTN